MKHIHELSTPAPQSHKGMNGKLLIIGGSALFHAPLIWSAETASRIVDMVHVTSPYLLNNSLMELRLKERFFDGIVVPWDQVDDYITEDDVILIGPGMERNPQSKTIVDTFLAKYVNKKWVVDGGALQEVDHHLLNGNMIITPHHKEWARFGASDLTAFSKEHGGLTILLKGSTDTIVRGNEKELVEGGNAGMTKGGTGDVLAGLTAALATTNDLFLAATTASMLNKRAGDLCFERAGMMFNATDLMHAIPAVMPGMMRKNFSC